MRKKETINTALHFKGKKEINTTYQNTHVSKLEALAYIKIRRTTQVES